MPGTGYFPGYAWDPSQHRRDLAVAGGASHGGDQQGRQREERQPSGNDKGDRQRETGRHTQAATRSKKEEGGRRDTRYGSRYGENRTRQLPQSPAGHRPLPRPEARL